jgi:hypothetical protein
VTGTPDEPEHYPEGGSPATARKKDRALAKRIEKWLAVAPPLEARVTALRFAKSAHPWGCLLPGACRCGSTLVVAQSAEGGARIGCSRCSFAARVTVTR